MSTHGHTIVKSRQFANELEVLLVKTDSCIFGQRSSKQSQRAMKRCGILTNCLQTVPHSANDVPVTSFRAADRKAQVISSQDRLLQRTVEQSLGALASQMVERLVDAPRIVSQDRIHQPHIKQIVDVGFCRD